MPVFRKLKVSKAGVRVVNRLKYIMLPHRCGRCQARRTLRIERKRTWRDRARIPRCTTCGNKGWYLDRFKMKENRRKKCNCGGYEFVHRKGGGDCYDNPKSEERYLARERVKA